MTKTGPTNGGRVGKRGRYHHGDLRQALLAAAEEELAEKGVEGFTLRGCAKRAGVSHAAPAHHFASSEALLSSLAAEGFRRFRRAMEERLAGVADHEPRKRLVAAGLGYVDFALANPALLWLMFMSRRPDQESEELETEATSAFGLLVELVGAATGTDPTADPSAELDIVATWSIVHGLSGLLLSRRLDFARSLHGEDRDEAIASVISRSLPA